MRKILVDKNIQAIAEEYNQKLLVGKDFSKEEGPIQSLRKLSKILRNHSTIIVYAANKETGSKKSKAYRYVHRIRKMYSILNMGNIEHLRETFDDIIHSKDIKDISIISGARKELLYKEIVKAMRYDVVRGKIILPFIYRVGIKSCVYCNSQFAVTTSGKKNIKGYYELDHVLPKSKYPFLCTNFYNLVPVCSSCNKRKSDNDDKWNYHPYAESKEDYHEHEMVLTLKPEDLASYIVEPNIEKLKPHLQNANGREGDGYVELFNKRLGIDAIYAEHSDVVEEILWHHKIYSKGYVDGLDAQMRGLGINGFDFRRYILGTYPDEKDAHKRPLTILAQDIWKQLEGDI